MFADNYNQLKKQLNFKNNKFKYNRNKKAPMLPFTTREPERVDFKNGFLPIIGALARIASNNYVDSINVDSVINNIINNDDFEYEEKDKYIISSLIEEYLNNTKLSNLIHPKLLLFLPLSDSDEKEGEIKAAEFLNSVFFKNIDFKEVITGDDGFNSNVLLDFITDNLDELNKGGNDSIYYMPHSLKGIIDIFEEDFSFLLKHHKSYLIHNLDLILAYYYFLYITQYTLKANLVESSANIEELYYLLDWESVSRSRIATRKGFNKVNTSIEMLLTNMNLMDHVNILLGEKNLLTFEIIDYVNEMDVTDRQEFLKYFKKWISELRASRELDEVNIPNDIKDLIRLFQKSIDDSVDDKAPNSRLGIAVRSLGIKYFLKTRGRYGYMLNMNQDLLILITAICIKEDKIKVSKLFEEYERRGIFFDRESKDLIIALFNNLNLIDKKSDSGDVQYVKSIL